MTYKIGHFFKGVVNFIGCLENHFLNKLLLKIPLLLCRRTLFLLFVLYVFSAQTVQIYFSLGGTFEVKSPLMGLLMNKGHELCTRTL